MSDLISVKSAVEALAELVPYAIDDDVTKAYMDALTDACDLICQLPSVQPEIIRCRECKHVQEDKLFGQCWCNGSEVKTDDFCSRAERREG